MFEKSTGRAPRALLANVSGTPLALVEVGGRFGRELPPRARRRWSISRSTGWPACSAPTSKAPCSARQVTRWNDEPWTLGAFSAASPGGQPARKMLMEPIRDRVYLAGEAVHETLWGTVGGAWESGERAANLVMRRLAGAPDSTLQGPSRSAEPGRPKSAASRGPGGVRCGCGGRLRRSRRNERAAARAGRLVERQGQRLGAA